MKVKLKRGITFFLTVILCATFFQDLFLNVAALSDGESLKVFDVQVYKAHLLTSVDSFSNGIDAYMSINTPAEVLTSKLQKDKGFMTSVAGWELLTQNPADMSEDALSDVEYYEATLLSMLSASTQTSEYCDILFSDTNKDVLSLLQSSADLFEEIKDIDDPGDISQIKAVSQILYYPDMDKEIAESIKSKGMDNLKAHQVPSKALEYASTAIDLGGTVYDYFVDVATYAQLVCMSESMINVLDEMYAQCSASNVPLKTAILKVKTLCEDNILSSIVVAMDGGAKLGSFAYKMIVNAMWSDLVEAAFGSVGVGLLIGQQFGRAAADLGWGTDKTIEQFYQMRALTEVLDLNRSMLRTFRQKYVEDNTTKNANDFLAALNLFFSGAEVSCDYAKEFADIVYTGGIWQKITKGSESEEYNRFIGSCESIKNSYSFEYDQLANRVWLIYLQDEYPDIYSIITKEINEPTTIKVTGVNVEEESVTWGVDDLFQSIHAEVVPEYATNKKIHFETSDSSIVVVDELGWCVPVSVGEALITVTSDDGNYTKEVKVTIVESNDTQETVEELNKGDRFEVNNLKYRLLSEEEHTVSVSAASKDMTNVYIPASVAYKGTLYFVTSVENDGFSSRYAQYKKVTIAEGVKGIGYRAFKSNQYLNQVILPSSITYIESGAFEDCTSLSDVSLGNCNNYSIPEDAFNGCKSLKSITLSNSVNEICSQAFANSGLEYIDFPDSLTKIEWNAFESCKFTQISIPDQISVQNHAFYNCSLLDNISFSSSIKSLNGNAFDGTKWYEDQPEGFLYLNDVLMEYKGTIPEGSVLAVKEGTKRIASCAFEKEENLTSVVIPDSLTVIDSYAFNECTNIESVDFSNGLKDVGYKAFYACKSIQNFVFPESIENIGGSAFGECVNLNTVEINSCPQDKFYFYGCKDLKKVIINVEEFTNHCCYVTNISESGEGTEMIFTDKVKRIDPAEDKYFSAKGITKITISSKVEYISDKAFSQYSNLKHVYYDSSLCDNNSVGKKIFPNSLEKITIGKDVTYIPNDFLYENSNLQTVEFENEDNITYIGSKAFDGTKWFEEMSDSTTGAKYIGKCLFRYFGDYSEDVFALRDDTHMICYAAFRGKTLPDNIVFPTSLEYIGESAFERTSNLHHYELLDLSNTHIKRVESNAFYFNWMEAIRFNNEIEYIGDYAFAGYGYAIVSLPDSVKHIGDHAFVNFNFSYDEHNNHIDEYVYSIYVPSSVEEFNGNIVGNTTRANIYGEPDSPVEKYATERGYAFYYSYPDYPYIAVNKDKTYAHDFILGSKSVVFPASIESIHKWFFDPAGQASPIDRTVDWNAVEDITLTNNNQLVDLRFLSLNGLKTITLGKQVSEIPDDFFSYQVTVPTKINYERLPSAIVLNIENGNPYYMKLDHFMLSSDKKNLIYYDGSDSSVTIPSFITKISSGAFAKRGEINIG